MKKFLLMAVSAAVLALPMASVSAHGCHGYRGDCYNNGECYQDGACYDNGDCNNYQRGSRGGCYRGGCY